MNLKMKSGDPRRLLIWNNKSIMNCSKDELMEAVIKLSQQVGMAQRQIDDQAGQIKALTVAPQPAKPQVKKKKAG